MIMPIPLEASIREGAHVASVELAEKIKLKLHHKLTADIIQNIIMIAMHEAKDYGR